MKPTFLCIVVILMAAGATQANSVIACNGTAGDTISQMATQVNTCYAAQLTDFNTQLYWNTLTATNVNAPAAFNGNMYDTTWDGTTPDNVDITVTGDSLNLAENYAGVPNGVGGWRSGSSVPNHPYIYSGAFDAAPDSIGTGSAVTPGAPCVAGATTAPNCYNGRTPGDVLIGLTDTSFMTIGSSQDLTDFGFRIASVTNTSFNMVLELFASDNGTGTPVQTFDINGLNGADPCTGLFSSPPVPCNTAPFIEVITSQVVQSFSISVNDPTGFYLDTLQLEEEEVVIPEPSSMLLAGIGMALLIALARRKRAA